MLATPGHRDDVIERGLTRVEALDERQHWLAAQLAGPAVPLEDLQVGDDLPGFGRCASSEGVAHSLHRPTVDDLAVGASDVLGERARPRPAAVLAVLPEDHTEPVARDTKPSIETAGGHGAPWVAEPVTGVVAHERPAAELAWSQTALSLRRLPRVVPSGLARWRAELAAGI